MPLGDEYPHGLEPVDGVTEKPGGYEEAVDRAAAEEAYREEVERQERVEAIREQYDEWCSDRLTHVGADIDEEGVYVRAVEAVRGSDLDLQPKTVARYCDKYSIAAWDGFFVSALVNESSHDTFVLPDMGSITYIGYRNRKDVTVEGDVKNAAGMQMEGGTLTIQGDAGKDIGQGMEHGTIKLHGAGDLAVDADGTVEHVNGVRQYTIEDDGVLGRLRDVLGGG